MHSGTRPFFMSHIEDRSLTLRIEMVHTTQREARSSRLRPFLEASKSNDDKLIVSHEEEENHHPFMGSLFSAIN